MKRPIVIILLLVLVLAILVTLKIGCHKGPNRSAEDIAGQYVLINLKDIKLANPNTQLMTITAIKGKKFIVRGIGWVAQGEVHDQYAYYDWKFDDGRTGRTTMFINYDDHTFSGHVVGSGLDWWYLARHPRTGTK
jgi:hypothetical protein